MIKTPLSTVIGGVGMYTKKSLIIGGGKTEPPFDPATLFENGEIGTLLDATDLSGIYQDVAGISQSSQNQPIGLILDKSTISADILDSTDFTKTKGNWNISVSNTPETHRAVLTENGLEYYVATATPIIGISQAFQGVAGKWLLLEIEVSDYVSGTLKCDTAFGTVTCSSKNGINRSYIQLSGSSLVLYRLNAPVNLTIKSIKLKLLKSNIAYQTTSAARPLLQNDIKFDGIDDALNITFPSALTNCTIFTVKHGEQAQILDAQSVAQNHIINQDFKYYGIVNRALTSAERAGLVSYLNKLGAQ